MTARPTEAWRIRLHGVVQGVGVRPFVFRLARQTRLSGWVRNDSAGVLIHVEGSVERLQQFRELLRQPMPAGAVTELACAPAPPAGHDAFHILDSQATRAAVTRVPPDRARCPRCLQDIFTAGDRRQGYPFTTCTECGPRYSLLQCLPYDRSQTGMADFPLCGHCQQEYADPDCRRLHAQSIACPACGPRVWLTDRNGQTTATAVFHAAAQVLRAGKILVLKGLGGFQLLVRADCPAAIQELRRRKQRPTKPFAVMVRDVAGAQRLARLDSVERALLESAANPIVLLERLPGATPHLTAEVAPGIKWIGLLLPTTPLHDLLLAEVDFPVVATSGNLSAEPIETENESALARLAPLATACLLHDRPILRRVDDSVVRVAAGKPVTIRLARGYTPLPLPHLEEWLARRGVAPAPLLAVGGQQKAAIAFWTGTQAVLSPHIGDLDGLETRAAFTRLIAEWAELYGCLPARLACDLHPDYFSTRWAKEQHAPVVQVQHHHAHAVAVMAEHGLLAEQVLAFTWDGTGYGADGTIWGGEALLARTDRCTRVASLRPFPLPGGDAAIREPARVALVLLAMTLGAEAVLNDNELLTSLGLTSAQARLFLTMSARGLNSPMTTSMGRLFDGLAALVLGIHRVDDEAQAAARLESCADDASEGAYPFDAAGDWAPLVAAVLRERRCGIPAPVIAGRFHQALANWTAAVAAQHPAVPIVLGGGCFQNRLLLEKTLSALRAAGRRVYHASLVPPGDGGLAVGQLAVALATLDQGGG